MQVPGCPSLSLASATELSGVHRPKHVNTGRLNVPHRAQRPTWVRETVTTSSFLITLCYCNLHCNLQSFNISNLGNTLTIPTLEMASKEAEAEAQDKGKAANTDEEEVQEKFSPEEEAVRPSNHQTHY